MKRCKNLACVKWTALDELEHALKGDITVINGLELTVRQTWHKTGCKEEIEPVIRVLNMLRWRLQDRIGQINDVVIENDK